ncbi:MAG: 1-phosphofructokinase [Lachnospiraceae bacterium]|nr:1-phosphofructokinase [Lachnospiraceae bacterium]
MILTVSCNPAIDKTYNTSNVIIGQINRMRDLVSIPGGKAVNVTKVLRQFDAHVTATGFVGGYTGEFIEEELRNMGVNTSFTTIRGLTRSNMNIIGDDGYVTEILEPGPKILSFEREDFMDRFRELVKISEYVVLSGSLTEGLSEDFYAKLIKICNEHGSKAFLDTSGEPLKKGIEAVPYCIKPNRRELEYAVGKKLSTEAEIIQAAYEYIKAGVVKVVVSMGDKGLLQITKTKVIKAVPPRIKKVNTVGCGDCVVAAMILGMIQGLNDEDTMKFAAGVSAANATTLESGMIPQDTMEKLIQDVVIVTV